MDYKKLYEKAVERAKTLTNSGFNDFDFVKHIFPELKESEDEKIRKGIIRNLGYLMDRAEGFVKDELKERIAWLEKQDEQKSNPCDGCINRKGCINCENGELREVEQKPAWSEEDELKRTTLIDVVKKQRGSAIFEGLLPEELTDWLESLKNRVLPQPKSEWGEEDEEKFRDVIRLIEQGAPVQSMRDHYTNWLKSLRPQNTWKPTEEQLRELHCVISGCSYETPVLVELEKQLKNLL